MANLQITEMKTADLTPYTNNAKTHPEEQILQIMESIEEFGMNDPIAVWGKQNLVVEGHGRLEACKRLGMETVPVIRLDHLSDKQRKKYCLVHNKLTMDTDFDLDILNKELDAIGDDDFMRDFGFDTGVEEEDPEVHDDDYEEVVPAVPKSKVGEKYRLGDHILVIGDCTEEDTLNALMGDDVADCVMTDPPYNVAIENSKGDTIQNDNMGDEHFEAFLSLAFEQIAAHMAYGASFYVWYASRNVVPFEQALQDNGLGVHQQLIWVKNSLVLGRSDYQWRHEPCLYGWKEGASHYFCDRRDISTVFEEEEDLSKWKKDDLVQALTDIREKLTTVCHEDKPKADDLHPTMKPIPLIGRMIANSTTKGDIVLDAFGGSGSTLIACEQLGRRCRISELDPRYADVIIDRWETFTGEKAERLDG